MTWQLAYAKALILTSASATALFCGLRQGLFGTTNVSLLDTKQIEHQVLVYHGPLQDLAFITSNTRIDRLLYEQLELGQRPGPPAQFQYHSSFKPLVYKIIDYPEADVLEKQLRSALIIEMNDKSTLSDDIIHSKKTTLDVNATRASLEKLMDKFMMDNK